MKLISVVTPCYNEEDNVRALHEAVKAVFDAMPQYTFEHIFIDNASTDRTQPILREMAAADPTVKAIFNTRNFGQIRSPFHAILQAKGDAVVAMCCDFQDPPDLIPKFIEKWEAGYKTVLGVKESAEESMLMYGLRSVYYKFTKKLADVELLEHATGFGLYDQLVVQALKKIDDPYPYTRGLLADIGYDICKITYHQPARRRGITKNNFYTLYDIAMLGITNHSKVPLRVAAMVGFGMSALSLLAALLWLLLKLVFWNYFTIGVAPLLISLFFFASVQLFFIGILGEYISAIHTQVQKRPLVIERERLNFGVANPGK